MLDRIVETRFNPIAREYHTDISEKVCPMHYETSDGPVLPKRLLLGCKIGEVSVVQYESFGVERGIRTIEHIRSEPLDYFLLCLPLQARFRFQQAGLETDIGYGDAVLLTAQRPFDAYVHGISEENWHSSLQVRIPGSLLRSRLPLVDALCNRPFSILSGAGPIMRTVVEGSLKEAQALTEWQALRHSSIVVDVIANSMLPMSQDRTLASLPDCERSRFVFERAMAYIECHLSSPNLDAGHIAEYCKVSLRYLHKIFEQRSQTVAGVVREIRLQCCRQALRDVWMAKRSVIEIAGNWGFTDPSHFGRIYKRRFGISPSQDRGATGSLPQAVAS